MRDVIPAIAYYLDHIDLLLGRHDWLDGTQLSYADLARTVILFIRCFGGAARRAESNEPSAASAPVDRLGPAAGRGAAAAAVLLAIGSSAAGAGAGDHGAAGAGGGEVTSYRVAGDRCRGVAHSD